MNKFKIIFTGLLMLFIAFSASAQVKKQPVKKAPVSKTKVVFKPPVIKKIPGTRVKITTDSGVIIVRLYDKTPKHRDNFIKLANAHFFDSLLFHRVMQGFMIQDLWEAAAIDRTAKFIRASYVTSSPATGMHRKAAWRLR